MSSILPTRALLVSTDPLFKQLQLVRLLLRQASTNIDGGLVARRPDQSAPQRSSPVLNSCSCREPVSAAIKIKAPHMGSRQEQLLAGLLWRGISQQTAIDVGGGPGNKSCLKEVSRYQPCGVR